jgi:hypothetical protein
MQKAYYLFSLLLQETFLLLTSVTRYWDKLFSNDYKLVNTIVIGVFYAR